MMLRISLLKVRLNHLEKIEQGLNEGFSVKEELDIDEIPFESQVSEEF